MVRGCLGGHFGKIGHFEKAEVHGNALNELSILANHTNNIKYIKNYQLVTKI